MDDIELTQEYLKSRLDRQDDRFYWKSMPVVTWQDKRWNTRHSGKIAGTLSKDGYRRINFIKKNRKSKRCLEHRLVWLWIHGRWPADQIDHINGVRDDNRLENLRVVCHSDNNKNQCLPKDNTSGVIGIHRYKATGKWRAQIMHKGKNIHLGYFYDKEDAVNSRKAADIKYGYHQNHGKIISLD